MHPDDREGLHRALFQAIDSDASHGAFLYRLKHADGSWVWIEDGVIRFKAEASARTPRAVQIQQVWVDPVARRQGYAGRGMRDLVRLLLAATPVVTLFVRTDNAPAIRLYESIGMTLVGRYRSVLL